MASKKTQPITEDYLDKTLDKKLESFVTKDYLDKKLESFTTKEYLDKRLKSELKKTEDRVVNRIIDEFKKTQEEDEAHQFSHTRINDDLEEIQIRVKKLEHSHS